MNQTQTIPTLGLASLAAILLAAPAGAQCQSIESHRLASPEVFAGDAFGQSVAVSGSVAVVGAAEDDFGAGAAYVYEFDGADWRFMAKLTSSDTATVDEFGYAAAIDGDLIVVGAHQPSPAEQPGAAYVYERPAGGWTSMTETARLTASDGLPNDNFGHAVAVDGGVVVVGAYLNDHGDVNTGGAYVFDPAGGSWTTMTETAKLVARDGNAHDQFGVSVSIDGDTVIAGADRDSDALFHAGSAYVFEKPGGGWTNMQSTAKLTVGVPVDIDRFGLSVGISGDTAVVGAWGDDEMAQKAGAAYVFTMPAGGWVDATETAKLTASDASAGDHLGWAVGIDGDVIAAGAPANLFDGSGSGGTYLYLAPAGGWVDATEDASVTSSHGAENDEFGSAVSIDSHMMVVGARWHETDGFSNAGAAYLFGGTIDCNDDGMIDLCEIVIGIGDDADGDGMLDTCQPGPCAGDANGDSEVNVDDIVVVVLAWGTCPVGDCPADVTGDGNVDVDDIVEIVLSWGSCTP